jgi:hypothetical protein
MVKPWNVSPEVGKRRTFPTRARAHEQESTRPKKAVATSCVDRQVCAIPTPPTAAGLAHP